MRYSEALKEQLGGYRPNGYTFEGLTDTMAAGLASGGAVLGARFPLAGVGKTLIDWLHLHYVCLGAFTTPVTAGRRLELKRGSGGDPSAGTALTITEDDANSTETKMAGFVATTGALTMTSVVLESTVKARLLLAHAGAAGNDYDELWSFADHPLVLAPGNLIALVAGAAFDAAGTWQLAVTGHATHIGLV